MLQELYFLDFFYIQNKEHLARALQYIYLALNGNSLIINNTGHIEQLVDWYTKAPSVFRVKEMHMFLSFCMPFCRASAR